MHLGCTISLLSISSVMFRPIYAPLLNHVLMNVRAFTQTGKHVRLATVLRLESVKSRLDSEEGGMSFTEFTYALLQAHDFAHLSATEVHKTLSLSPSAVIHLSSHTHKRT